MTASEAGFDIESFCRSCHVADTERFLARCCALYDVLVMTNRQYNLTRIDSPEGYWAKHIADSLTVAKYYPRLAEERLRVADIGCGAGFPALVLALAFPNLWIMAIDSTGKKIKFVRQAASILELKNLRTTHGRAGELNRLDDWKEDYQVITARAVAPAARLYGETRNMLDPLDGRYILYKTPEHVRDDLPAMNVLTGASGISWGCSEEFELPNRAGRRQFLHSN